LGWAAASVCSKSGDFSQRRLGRWPGLKLSAAVQETSTVAVPFDPNRPGPPRSDGPSDKPRRPPTGSDAPTRAYAEQSLEDGADFEIVQAKSSEPVQTYPQSLGDYTITGHLGGGGMGEVYKAVHRRMNRTVALKLLPPNRLLDPQAVTRFYNEVQAAAKVLHPNVVVAFDAGQANGLHYLAMEHVDGETFGQLVQRRGPLPIDEAIQLICQAARGLQQAHDAGMVHRDVKPGNIMVDNSGVVKVLDLGLAAMLSEMRPGGGRRLTGTVEYMAPEQLLDPDNVGPAADIYALGATLFFLLAGRPPFVGGLLELARAHRREPPPELYMVRADAGLRLDHIFQRMMAKSPAQRQPSMRDVIHDLESLEKSLNLPAIPSLGTIAPYASRSLTHWNSGTGATQSAILGIDLGLFQAAGALAQDDLSTEVINLGGEQGVLARCAIANHGNALIFGSEAWQLRAVAPEQVTHCLQMYLGRSLVDRNVAGRQCPPEALIALLLRSFVGTVSEKTRQPRPRLLALGIPACLDQAQRRSMRCAAQMSGFKGTQLVDRPLAAAFSQLLPDRAAAPPPLADESENWLVVELTGLAAEAMVVRYSAGQLQAIAARGSLQHSGLLWQQRLIDLAAAACQRQYQVDPRLRLADAVRLQVAGEAGLRRLLFTPELSLPILIAGREATITVRREALEEACSDLIDAMQNIIQQTIASASVSPTALSRVLMIGSLARQPCILSAIQKQVGPRCQFIPIDQPSIACGVAAAAAAAFNIGDLEPPRPCSTHPLGLLVVNDQGQRQGHAIIPADTSLPVRRQRRVRLADEGGDAVTIIEGCGLTTPQWKVLERCRLGPEMAQQTVETSFAVDGDGLLTVDLRGPTGQVRRLEELPRAELDTSAIRSWREWIEETMLCQPERPTSPQI
jgi:serine/threonine protein kinase/molecular chaperone DnaK (HSP70)